MWQNMQNKYKKHKKWNKPSCKNNVILSNFRMRQLFILNECENFI